MLAECVTTSFISNNGNGISNQEQTIAVMYMTENVRYVNATITVVVQLSC